MSVYAVALVRNENEGLVKFKDPTMVCRLFAANPGRGRGRNYVNLLFSVFHLATMGYCVFYCPWTYQCFICCWRRLAVSVVTLLKDNNRNVSSDPAGIYRLANLAFILLQRNPTRKCDVVYRKRVYWAAAQSGSAPWRYYTRQKRLLNRPQHMLVSPRWRYKEGMYLFRHQG
jgi:hypothetical protein